MERKKKKYKIKIESFSKYFMPEMPDGETSFFNHANQMCQFSGRI